MNDICPQGAEAMTWPMTTLGKLASFRNGLNYTKANWGHGLHVIGVKDFKNRVYPHYTTLGQINPEGVASDHDLLAEGDILLVRSNGNRRLIGRSLYIKELPFPVAFSGFCIRARLHPLAGHSRFYAYLLRSDPIRRRLSAQGGRANIASLNQGTLTRLSVPCPPLDVQQRIAEILCAYDDLIENNNRRMALLETSLHLVFREWFVDLRFPKHHCVKVLDGVPSGWIRTSVHHAIAVNPPTPIARDQVRPYVPMRSLSTNSMRLCDLEQRLPKGGSTFRNGDTLLARITPCLENGKTALVQFMDSPDEAASGSTELIVMRGKTVPATWVYCLARSSSFRQEAINRMSGSDGRQRVDSKALAEVEILVPPAHVTQAFESKAGAIVDQIHHLTRHNRKLREARDLLLPRLIPMNR